MATKNQKSKSTKATKTNAVTVKVASLKQIREAANMAFDQHFTRQHNESWMLSQIAENNPGLVYYWNPTNIGIKLKKAAVDVNKILENMGFQERKNKTWTLTPKGEKYAVLRPFEVKHENSEYAVSGLQILWSIDVIPLIRAWLKGPDQKPAKTPTSAFNADMDEQQLLDQLLVITEKTLNDEFSAYPLVDMELEQAKELATKLYSKLRCHWKAVTCYAQSRKNGCSIQIKVLVPKPEGSSEPQKPAATVATPQVASFSPTPGLSNQQLVDELLAAIGKSLTDEFSVPIPVDMELEQAQELATRIYAGLLKNWTLVTCYARPRKSGSTIQVKAQSCKLESAA